MLRSSKVGAGCAPMFCGESPPAPSLNFAYPKKGNLVTKYAGKLAGDEIKGSIERPGRGEGQPPQKTDWLAKREAATAAK